ncbi:unnamed protein product [Schistosoma margrebowiei]|uniref:Proteasome subunit beta type-4 n=1 Tax=Schistosoma margrebowiei TaxID=48269 RepID=A0A183MSA2_9TREM|nr:unnamed protein product [Schistosoma margrebowiei]
MDSLKVQFPNNPTDVHGECRNHTMTPICTGTSVIGIKYRGGVVLAADTPHALHSWITRVLYNRRSRLQPLWNTYLVGGLEANGEPFIGYCSMLGVSFTENYVATGFGAYLAMPILRECLEIKAGGDPNNITEEDAISTITSAMKQLYFRDCRAFDTYQMAVVNKEGIQISGPLRLKCDWSIAEYVKGYD